jgi:branched-chain amino acid transport system permease protein
MKIKPKIKKILSHPFADFVYIAIFLLLILLLSYVKVFKSSTLIIFYFVIMYTIISIGLNVLLGYSGLISLGTAGFVGLGAYMTGLLMETLKLSYITTLFLSMIIPVALGIILGLVTLRMDGIFLAIATLGIAEIFRKTFEEFINFTGGFSGLRITRKITIFYAVPLDRYSKYLLAVFILLLIMMLIYNLVNSKIGRAFLTMKISEPAARAMGINIFKYRLYAFALSTALASLGGFLYMTFLEYNSPEPWNLNMSLTILTIVVIGGLKSLRGTFFGALIIYGIPELILKKIPVIGQKAGVAYTFSGLLIIIILLFYPKGVVNIPSSIREIIKKIKAKRNNHENQLDQQN